MGIDQRCYVLEFLANKIFSFFKPLTALPLFLKDFSILDSDWLVKVSVVTSFCHEENTDSDFFALCCRCSPWAPKFSIRDADGQKVLSVDGPCCVCQGAWCCEQEFQVKSLLPNQLGIITQCAVFFCFGRYTDIQSHERSEDSYVGLSDLLCYFFFRKKS